MIVRRGAATADVRKMPERCTGITAIWCPIHGDCTCDPLNPAGWDQKGRARASMYDTEKTLDDSDCPLHSFESEHGA